MVSSNKIAPVVVSVTSMGVVVGRDGRGGIGMISKSLVFSGSSKVSWLLSSSIVSFASLD